MSPEPVTSFEAFRRQMAPSWEDICRTFYRANREKIRIKKEPVAVRNLQKVLHAVLALSKTKGFHAMTLRDLGAAAGLSTGVLYSCFASKEELHRLLLEQGVTFVVDFLKGSVRGSEGATERLRRAIRHHLYLSEVFSAWFYFLYMDARNLKNPERERAMRNEMATERIFHDLLAEGEREGVFVVEDKDLTASAIKCLLQDWYLKRWKYRRRKVTIDAYADFVERLVLASVLA